MEPSQGLELAQALKLSPTLLQSMEILQMNTLELAEYLKDLALENPVLEEAGPGAGQEAWEAMARQTPWLTRSSPDGDGAIGEPGRRDRETGSLEFLLNEQLDRLGLEKKRLAVCRYLVDLLDDRGRLDPEDLERLVQAGVPRTLLDQGIAALQGLEPAGVGARSLGECLALQLERLPGDHTVALAICQKHLDLLGEGRYGAIAKALGLSLSQVRQGAGEIQALEPNPVGDLAPEEPIEYLRPDAWIVETEGKLRVYLNEWDLPDFHLSQQYARLAREEEGETAVYLRDKLRQAQWVLQCVQRRRNTLTRCLETMAAAQEDYFLGRQAAPGPLLRRELAERLDLHPSTVTRALRHKVIQCRQGTFSAACFFGRRTGPGELSARQVKVWLAEEIRQEDPRRPLSDRALASRLAHRGAPLARRTVTKYRQALGLPPACQRRREEHSFRPER